MSLVLPSSSDLSSGSVSKEEFQEFLKTIDLNKLSVDQLQEVFGSIKKLDEIDTEKQLVEARSDFLTFFKLINPTFVIQEEGHHGQIADIFERLVDGDLKRVNISTPPRYTKSEMTSIALPAWALGKNPNWKIIQASSTDILATDFGRKVKNLISSDIYRKIFPGVTLSKDSKASGKFATNHGGEYYAVGVGGAIAGRGADIFIIDDATSEQEARSGDPKVYESAWTWFQSGPLQRLQPGGRLLNIATRWSKADIIGRIEKRMQIDPKADRYESVVFPALDEDEESTFPKFWSTEELKAKRDNMAPHLWSAQYQQNPTAESSSIVPRSRWREWDNYDERKGGFVTPDCFYTIMVWDTAFTEKKRSNPSACTIWGVFKYRDSSDIKESNHIILLGAFKRKMEPALLKKEAKRLIKEWQPDTILIEAITSGISLRSELREAGIMTEPCRPKKGEDKMARLNSVSDLFYSGKVWYIPTSENDAVLQEVNDFPGGLEDDYTDTTGYALRRFRDGGFVQTVNDEIDEDVMQIPRKPNY